MKKLIFIARITQHEDQLFRVFNMLIVYFMQQTLIMELLKKYHLPGQVLISIIK